MVGSETAKGADMSGVKRGSFVVFEGLDGSGKSTVARMVYEQLVAEGAPIILTREPGGSLFAEEIREVILSEGAAKADVLTMLYLFNAARIEHLRKRVQPALEKGVHVLCDRFDASTYAYQVVAGEDPTLASLFAQMRVQYQSTLPHYIFLSVSPEVGRARMHSRGKKNHYDRRDAAFHGRVRSGFLDFMHGFCKSDGVSIIDAERSLELVYEDALATVRRVLAR